MRLKVVPIGNSRGIRIPKTLLEEYGIEDEVELDMQKDKIFLIAVKKPRQNWKESLRTMHETGDDDLLLPDVFEDEEI